jgi:hypothetical protein
MTFSITIVRAADDALTCFVVIVRSLVVLEVGYVPNALHLYLLLEQVLHVQK